uniref:Uncharacterized protein n=1 Tax=Arundo donax TaxID=35708 RepID=A0A0A9EHZ6_ARUDO
MNFHMNNMVKTLAELYGMLKTAEESIKKSSNHVMMIQKERKRKHGRRLKAKPRERFPVSPRTPRLSLIA